MSSRQSFRFESLCELYGIDEDNRQASLVVIRKLGQQQQTTLTIKNIEDIIVNTTKLDDSPHKKQKLARLHRQYFKVFGSKHYRWVATIVAKQQFCEKLNKYADLDTKYVRPGNPMIVIIISYYTVQLLLHTLLCSCCTSIVCS